MMLQVEIQGPASGAARPGRWHFHAATALALLATLVLAAVLAAHAALLPGGRWQGDEYGLLAAHHQQGLGFLRYRLLNWSPRPFSESLDSIYAWLVFHWRAPLIAPALGFVWAMLGLAAASLLLGGDRPPWPGPPWPGPPWAGPRWPGLVWRGLIVAAVLAAFLLGHKIGEMFYWPLGALAYLPALAGLTAAAFLIIRGLDRPGQGGRRLACAAALLLAAGSAETGAMAALGVCGLIGLTELPGWARGARAPWRRLAGSAWWAVPMLASATVLVFLSRGRAGSAAEIQGVAAHQLWPSLVTAAWQFGALLVTPDGPGSPLAWWLLVLFAGLAGAWRISGAVAAPARHLLVLAAGLLLGAYASLASAAWEFGVPCCERHDSFRACLAVLALVALAALASRAGGAWGRVPAAAWPLLLLLGLLPPALDRAQPWLAEWRQIHTQIALRRADWASGQAPGPGMRLYQPLRAYVVNGGGVPAKGRFDRASGDVPWYVQGVLDFFGKQTVDFVDPNQPPGG
jgi:hypothetical protein